MEVECYGLDMDKCLQAQERAKILIEESPRNYGESGLVERINLSYHNDNRLSYGRIHVNALDDGNFMDFTDQVVAEGVRKRATIEEGESFLSEKYGVEVKCYGLNMDKCLQAQERAKTLIEESPRNYGESGLVRRINLSDHNDNRLSYGWIYVNALGDGNFMDFMDQQIAEGVRKRATIEEGNRLLSEKYGVEVECSRLDMDKCLQAQERAKILIEESPRNYGESGLVERINLSDHNDNKLSYGWIYVNALGDGNFMDFMDQQIAEGVRKRATIEEGESFLSEKYGVEVKCYGLNMDKCLQAQERAKTLIEESPRNYGESGFVRGIYLSDHNDNGLSYGWIYVNALSEENFMDFMDEQVAERIRKRTAIEEGESFLSEKYGVEVKCYNLDMDKCLQAQERAKTLIEESPRNYGESGLVERINLSDHNDNKLSYGRIYVNALGDRNFMDFMDQQIAEGVRKRATIEEGESFLSEKYGVEVECYNLDMDKCLQAQERAKTLIEESPRNYGESGLVERINLSDHNDNKLSYGRIYVNALGDGNFMDFMDQQIAEGVRKRATIEEGESFLSEKYGVEVECYNLDMDKCLQAQERAKILIEESPRNYGESGLVQRIRLSDHNDNKLSYGWIYVNALGDGNFMDFMDEQVAERIRKRTTIEEGNRFLSEKYGVEVECYNLDMDKCLQAQERAKILIEESPRNYGESGLVEKIYLSDNDDKLSYGWIYVNALSEENFMDFMDQQIAEGVRKRTAIEEGESFLSEKYGVEVECYGLDMDKCLQAQERAKTLIEESPRNYGESGLVQRIILSYRNINGLSYGWIYVNALGEENFIDIMDQMVEESQ